MMYPIRPAAYALLAATVCVASPRVIAADHAAQARKRFAAMDTDADGRVTATEIGAANAKLLQRP